MTMITPSYQLCIEKLLQHALAYQLPDFSSSCAENPKISDLRPK